MGGGMRGGVKKDRNQINSFVTHISEDSHSICVVRWSFLYWPMILFFLHALKIVCNSLNHCDPHDGENCKSFSILLFCFFVDFKFEAYAFSYMRKGWFVFYFTSVKRIFELVFGCYLFLCKKCWSFHYFILLSCCVRHYNIALSHIQRLNQKLRISVWGCMHAKHIASLTWNIWPILCYLNAKQCRLTYDKIDAHTINFYCDSYLSFGIMGRASIGFVWVFGLFFFKL